MSFSFDFPWGKGKGTTVEHESAAAKRERYLIEVLINLWMKKWLLDANDPRYETIRTAGLFLSGGQAGAFGAGRCRALAKVGLTQVFDIIGGVSIGALLAAYLISGQIQEASEFFLKICKKEGRKYINPRGRIVNVRALIDDHIRKHMNTRSVRESRSRLYVGVTDVTDDHNPQGKILDAKSIEYGHDILDYIEASMTVIPFGKPVRLGDRVYCDGIAGNPCPVDLLKNERESPTHILVLTNGPEKDLFITPLIKWILATAALIRHSREIREAHAHYHNKARNQLILAHKSQDPQCIVGIAYDKNPTGHKMPVTALTRDPERLKAAMDQSEADMTEKLEYARTLAVPRYAQMFAENIDSIP